MKINAKVFALSLGLLGLSVATGLGAAEVFLRLFPQYLPEEAQLRIHWASQRDTTRAIPDPYIGFLNPPYAKGWVRAREASFAYSTDEHGFRNPGPWPTQADIIGVGDSNMFGFGMGDDQTWMRLVADSLPHSRVMNLGLSGAAPQQYLRVYERFGSRLKPKLLLFGLFPGNDLSDAKLFDDWLRAGEPVGYDVWRFFRGRPPSKAEGAFAPLKKSYLYHLVRTLNRNLASPFAGETIDCADGGRLRLAPRVLVQNTRMAHPGDRFFEVIMETVEQARALARQDGTEFLVVLFPTKEEVYLPVLGKPAPHPLGPFRAELQKRGIPYLDLTPFFQEEARRGECIFFEVDGHPNVRGAQLIAKVLVDSLRNKASLYGLRVK